VESIPYTETREYVQAILRNREIYRALYATP
jgi:soluble lytic murein transglycosylase